MIACVDVGYRESETVTACVGIRDWADATPCLEEVRRTTTLPAPYEPGQFYLREMPLLVDILSGLSGVETVVIDGYVWLAASPERPGLGARLHDAIHLPIIGVAKTSFHGNDAAFDVL